VSFDPEGPTRSVGDATTVRAAPGDARGVYASDALPAGARVGRYTVVRRIGGGGFGDVYGVTAEELPDRRLALKVLRAQRATPTGLDRFMREVETLARLKHDWIATIMDSSRDGGPGGAPFLVLEYLDEGPIDGACDRAGLGVRERAALLADVCDAVEHAHRNGVVHRDIKPDNLLCYWGARGLQAKVADFGIARLMDVPGPTREGVAPHTPGYAPDEQLDGAADRVSDVYALGVTAREVILGERPGEDRATTRAQRAARAMGRGCSARALALAARGPLRDILARATANDPAARYESAAALGADLRAFGEGRPAPGARGAIARARATWHGACARDRFRWVLVAVVLLAAAAAQGLTVLGWLTPGPLIARWERLVAAPPPAAGLEHVRVVGFALGEDMSGLAARVGVEGVDVGADARSLRRLHAVLVDRLVRAGAGVVAFDMMFMDAARAGGTPEQVAAEADHNAPLVEAVRRAREAGVAVAAVAPFDELRSERPLIAPALARELRLGGATAAAENGRAWLLDVAVASGEEDPAPSMALQAVCAWRRRADVVSVRFRARGDGVEVLWQERAGDVGALRTLARERVPVTRMETFKPDDSSARPGGIGAGDVLAVLLTPVYAPDRLREATLSYADALLMPDDELGRAVAGRLVFIGTLNNPADRIRHPDGEMLPGVFAKAVLAETLANRRALRLPSGTQEWLMLLAGAAAGVACTLTLGLRRGALPLATVVAFAVVLVLCYGAAGALLLAHPGPPVAAAALGALGAWLAVRARAASGESNWVAGAHAGVAAVPGGR
jgi:hypothetical protein